MKLVYSIQIQSSPTTVFSWLKTPERAMVWQESVSRTEILHETPEIKGTTFRETIEGNGRSTDMHGIVTDYIENQVLAMHLDGEYNTVDVEWRLEANTDRTHLKVSADIRFKSFVRVLNMILRPVFKRKALEQINRECTRLKQLCERGE